MKKLWKDSKLLRENLQRRLPKLVAEYFAAGRQAMAPETSWEDMHRFRLETKRFRYTLETFRAAYGPGMSQRIDALKQIQTYLGDINDCIVTGSLLEPLAGTEGIRTKLAAKADSKTKKLRQHWIRQFDAEGREAQWIRYLRTYVCRRQPGPKAPKSSQKTEAAATAQGS